MPADYASIILSIIGNERNEHNASITGGNLSNLVKNDYSTSKVNFPVKCACVINYTVAISFIKVTMYLSHCKTL